MNKLIIFILTLLPVFSYSQVTSINIDTSVNQVIIIINNGTMIENNGGTVNIGTENKSQDTYKPSKRSDEGKCVYKYDLYSQREHAYTERECCNRESDAEVPSIFKGRMTVFWIIVILVLGFFIWMLSQDDACW